VEIKGEGEELEMLLGETVSFAPSSQILSCTIEDIKEKQF